jgi:hypothetical protein
VIQPSGNNFNLRGVQPTPQLPRTQQVAEVDEADRAIEEFLSSWASGTPGAEQMSLDQMLKIQSANPDVPQLPPVADKVTNSGDHALRQIEMLVSQNRSLFQNASPRSMTDGWNIAGQR